MVKNLSANAGDVGLIPGVGRSPGEGSGNHSSILSWRSPWTEEPGGLQSMGWQRVRSNFANELEHSWRSEETASRSKSVQISQFKICQPLNAVMQILSFGPKFLETQNHY